MPRGLGVNFSQCDCLKSICKLSVTPYVGFRRAEATDARCILPFEKPGTFPLMPGNSRVDTHFDPSEVTVY